MAALAQLEEVTGATQERSLERGKEVLIHRPVRVLTV